MAEGRGEGFLARWSRRKEAAPETREREDRRVAEERGEDVPAASPAQVETAPADLPPLESLTPQSDFSPFMRADVPGRLRSAAMKKLFADPHFNLMDGLDVYIDDYTRPDPIPPAMLRDLAQAGMLKLFEDDGAATPVEGGVDSAGAGVAMGATETPSVREIDGAQAPTEGEDRS